MADTTASTRAAAGAARTIPIVMAAALDPVALGLAHSLARPGGNVTGFTLMSHELSGKRVDPDANSGCRCHEDDGSAEPVDFS